MMEMVGQLWSKILGYSSGASAESEVFVAPNVPQTTNPFERITDCVYELRAGMNPKVDLVFFHGLPLSEEDASTDQSFWRIWTMAKRDSPEDCWPVTMLPGYLEKKKDANNADYDPRVLAVSYESSFEPPNVETKGTDDYLLSEILTWELILSVASVGQERPVILVGHDLGGILIKQLILYVEERAATEGDFTRRDKLNKFLENLGSVFFYSTPQMGSAAIERVAREISSEKTQNQMLRLMRVLGYEMSRVNVAFSAYRHRTKDSPRFGTFALAELYPTNKGYFNGEEVCVEGSSRNDIDTYYSVKSDHYDVCRPEGTWSVNFQMLADNVVSVVDAFNTKERATSNEEGFRQLKEFQKNFKGSDGQMHGSREASLALRLADEPVGMREIL